MPILHLPDPFRILEENRSIFLGGSIKTGKAEDWQQYIGKNLEHPVITILNLRRAAWNANWKQDITNPECKEQVNWELEGLEKADWIVMYFDPATKAPVSMLEFGLYAQSGKLLMCCPDGF